MTPVQQRRDPDCSSGATNAFSQRFTAYSAQLSGTTHAARAFVGMDYLQSSWKSVGGGARGKTFRAQQARIYPDNRKRETSVVSRRHQIVLTGIRVVR